MLKENFKVVFKENILLIGSLLSLQFVGFFGFFIKYIQTRDGGYMVVARTMGLTDGHQLPFLFKLSFFREDVLLNLIILPVGLLLILYLLKRKWTNCHIYIITQLSEK